MSAASEDAMRRDGGVFQFGDMARRARRVVPVLCGELHFADELAALAERRPLT